MKSAVKRNHNFALQTIIDHDGAEPSSNSVACSNLLRLASYLDRPELNDKAAQLLTSFRESFNRIPAALPELVSALLHYHDTTMQVTDTQIFTTFRTLPLNFGQEGTLTRKL